MSIESQIDSGRNRFESLPLAVKLAHEKITQEREKYEGPDYKIQLPNFTDHYGIDQLVADQKQVVALGKKFDTRREPWQVEAKKMAEVFETILIDESEMSNWLGESVTTRRTTTFDDYVHGIDMVAEYRDPHGDGFDTLALGIDVTFGKKTIQSKLERIRQNIDASEMGTIKYYEDSAGDFMGQLKNIPQFVIGADRDSINQLSGLWLEGEKTKLGEHPIQIILLKEILSQASIFGAYAQANKHPRAERAYGRVGRIISQVLEEKQGIATNGFEYDRIAQEITHETKQVCT